MADSTADSRTKKLCVLQSPLVSMADSTADSRTEKLCVLQPPFISRRVVVVCRVVECLASDVNGFKTA